MNIQHRLHKPSPWSVVSVCFALLVAAFAGATIYRFTAPEPWAPLGPFPVQEVTSQGPLTEGRDNNLLPVVYLGPDASVEITAYKCASEDVLVNGYYGWRSVEPPGISWPVVTAKEGFEAPPSLRLKTETDEDGNCGLPLTYENDIPSEVQDWAKAQIANGKSPEVILSGCETPTATDDGRVGVEECWRTGRIVLAYPSDPK